jgi:hypothetical protein
MFPVKLGYMGAALAIAAPVWVSFHLNPHSLTKPVGLVVAISWLIGIILSIFSTIFFSGWKRLGFALTAVISLILALTMGTT